MTPQHGETSSGFLQQLGPLRVALSLLVVVLVVLSPFSGMETDFDNWSVIPTIIAPVLVPIVFFVLWLDILMSKVFGSQAASGFDKKRHRLAIQVDLIALVGLVAAWVRFFYRLLA